MLFLLAIGLMAVSALYLEQRNTVALLENQIEQLEKNQVLLMVPEEHSQALAKWMQNNPNATELLLEQAKPGAEARVVIEPGGNNIQSDAVTDVAEQDAHLPYPQRGITADTMASAQSHVTDNHRQQESNAVEAANESLDRSAGISQPKTMSENDEGVKVISLPHGGIRVTTREDN